MEYDAIIIGSGVAGLFAGLKLSQAGKKILLIEKQPAAGGLATSFSRRGFSFESSLHCVDALGNDQDIRQFLKECAIDQRLEFIELKDFARIIYPGHDFIAGFPIENFINFLKRSFPAEEKQIGRLFCQLNRFYAEFDRFSSSRLPLWLQVVLSPFLYPRVIRFSCITCEQLLSRYIRDKKLRAIISDIWRFAGLPPQRLSALYFLLVFRGYYYQQTAYVGGGFSSLFQAMVERIEEAGSRVKFNTGVKTIITSGGAVKSVITENGEEFRARAVISNANAIDTLTSLLDNPEIKEKYRVKLAGLEKSISATQVYLGLKVPAKALGMSHCIFSINTTYDYNENFNYSLRQDYDNCSLELVDHAQIDPSLVPPGKGSLLIMTLDVYARWQGLTREEYERKKEEVADKLIRRAERYLPGLSGYIEVKEVATPLTISRFGSLPQGAIYGFAQTVNQSGINRLAQETRVRGLFLAGAWTQPGGGLHGCFVSGIQAAELALRFLKD